MVVTMVVTVRHRGARAKGRKVGRCGGPRPPGPVPRCPGLCTTSDGAGLPPPLPGSRASLGAPAGPPPACHVRSLSSAYLFSIFSLSCRRGTSDRRGRVLCVVIDTQRLQINQDRARTPPPVEGPFVDAEDARRRPDGGRRAAQQAQRHARVRAEPCPRLTAEGTPDQRQQVLEPYRFRRVGGQHAGETLGADATSTRGRGTEELAHVEREAHRDPGPRQVGDGTRLPAMAAACQPAAERAGCHRRGRHQPDRDTCSVVVTSKSCRPGAWGSSPVGEVVYG